MGKHFKKDIDAAPERAVLNAEEEFEYEPFPYLPAADGLKFWLMPFVCFVCFGFPTRYGGNISVLSGFAPLCFFILCGFFALTGEDDERERLVNGIKRSAIMFGIMFAVCFGVNILYYLLTGAKVGALFSALFSKRMLFNFIVLCAWPFPMGESIWFIQSLLYAYIILYILNRLGIMRFRWILFILCAALMLFSGELAGLVGFRFLGAPYLPPNVFTRALPYMLIGGFIRNKIDSLSAVKAWVYLLMVPAGLALAYGEFEMLTRLGVLITTSHAIGLGLTAFGLCAWVLLFVDSRPNFFRAAGRPYARRIYLWSQLVAFLLIVPLSFVLPAGAGFVRIMGGLAVYPVCLLLVGLIDMITYSGPPLE